MSWNSSELEDWTEGKWYRDLRPSRVTGFSIDSRRVQNDDLFIALKTDKRDGHEFVPMAQSENAAGAMVEHCADHIQFPQLEVKDSCKAFQRIAKMHRLSFEKPLIALTGSYGKTSTKGILSCLLGDSYYATEGNLNNYLGVPLSLLRLNAECHDGAVIETGINQKGEMEILADMIHAEVVLVTGIGPVHLEALGNLETIAEEKSKLITHSDRIQKVYLPASVLNYHAFRSIENVEVNVLTKEDSKPVGDLPENYKILTYKLSEKTTPEAGISIEIFNGSASGLLFKIPPMSRGMADNTALSLALGIDLGYEKQLLQDRINVWKPASMRGETKTFDKATFYVDCYNANRDALIDSVDWFRRQFRSGPRLLIIGSMKELGPEADQIHEETMRKIGIESDEKFILIGDHLEAMKNGLLAAGVGEESIRFYQEVPDADSWMDNWEGSILLKGSRAVGLERILKRRAG